ncbi:MAG: hypothetical protein M0R73_00755 [Dehalococcoidia bacterium]|nr:hypothetical protein [Dehalococcoidia bacterium]
MLDPDERQRLRERLDASRAVLLAALEGVTERDFSSDVGGETVVQLLARVAAEERDAVAQALGVVTQERTVEKPLPPQVIHALAGARYRTARYLDSPTADLDTARTLVEAAEQRESEAARRVRERPKLKPLPPPPEMPVIRP